MRILLTVLLLSLLLSCASNPSQQSSSNPNTSSASLPKASAKEEPSHSQKVYFLQHKLISRWLYESEGMFFDDLYNGDIDRLLGTAAEIVSPEYANGIDVNTIFEKNAVLIRFPTPESFANCFYSLAVKTDDGFYYYTYEKTLSFKDGDPIKGVVGGWDRKGSHSNYGGRTYTSSTDFIEDVLKIK